MAQTQQNKVPNLRFPEFLDAGDWAEKRLGEAATFLNGRAYKKEELLSQGRYRVLRVGNFFSNNEWYYSDLDLDDSKYCDNGDLLYAWSASFGPRIWCGEKVIYHYHIWKVVEKESIKKEFLNVILDFETERMKSQGANGLGLLHITKGTIEGWKSCFPKPPEQQKIAACLMAIDDLITAEAHKLEHLKVHKKGLMQQIFPAEGETVPRLRFPEFRDAGTWEEKRLGDDDVSNFVNDRMPLTKLALEDYVSTVNILPGFSGISQAPKLPPSGSVTRFKHDDILISNIRPYLRKVWLASKGGGASNDVIVVRARMRVSSRFLSFLLMSDRFVDYVMVGAKGVKMPRGDIAQIQEYPLSIPPAPEQQKIAAFLTSIDDLITAEAQKLEHLKAHKKGLMQQLFLTAKEAI